MASKTPAELAAALGGAELNSNSVAPATSTAPAGGGADNATVIAQKTGGAPLGGVDDNSGGSILKKIGNFFTGSTQAFGKDAGEALAANSNADLFTQAMQDHSDVTQKLIAAIAAKKKAGQDATRLQDALASHQQDTPQLSDFTGDTINKSNEAILGDALGTATEALGGGALGALPEEGASLGTKVLSGLKTGAGFGAAAGASGAMKNGESLGDTALSTLEGGLAGGAVGTGGELLGAGLHGILSSLPSRIVKSVIPDIDSETGAYFLKNSKLGSVTDMFARAKQSVSNLGQQISTALSHPDHIGTPVDTEKIVNDVLNGFTDRNGNAIPGFSDSNYTPSTILTTVKKLIPEKSALVDKIINGEADLADLNKVRIALDQATPKSVFDALNPNPKMSAAKSIGRTFASSLRDYVQTAAPETQSLFQNLQKEINLRNGLAKLAKKKGGVTLTDLLTGVAAAAHGNIPGALGAVGVEKTARNPLVQLGFAKGLDSIGNIVLPAANSTISALKTPVLKALTP